MKRFAIVAVLALAAVSAAVFAQEAVTVIFDMDTIRQNPGEIENKDKQKVPCGTAELVDGKFGQAVKFTFTDGHGGMFGNVQSTPEWDACEGFSFWVKGDGSKSWGGIELIDRNDFALRYAYCFPIDSKEWKKIVVPWRDMVPELPAGAIVDVKTGFKPSSFGYILFGKWWYWREYPPCSYTIDQVALEKKMLTEAKDYTPAKAGTPRLLSKLKAKQPVTVVTMGDSLSDKAHWANREVLWSELLVKALEEKYGSKVTFVNASMGGTILTQNLVVMPRWVGETPSPDVVTVWFGGNDFDGGMRGERFKEVLRYAVDRIRRETKGSAEIVLMTTCPGAKRWKDYDELCQAVRDVAGEKKTGLADIAAEFHKAPSAEEALKQNYWCWDGTHLGSKGHELTKDTVLKTIEGNTSAAQAARAQETPAAGKPAAGKPAAGKDAEFKKLVYVSDNFIHPANVDKAIGVLTKAAAAGYTGVLLADCKFDRWDETVTVQRPLYDDNVKRLRQACRDLKLEVIVSVLGQGMDLLSNDPNLAEGMPVVDAPFVVKGGRLVAADEDFKVVNGSFEEAGRENQPDGWYVDAPGKAGFLDTQVKFEGKQSLRFEDLKANSEHSLGRASQRVQVKPFRYYYASVMVRTQDFVGRGTFNFMVLGHANGLVHQTYDVAATQDWKKIEIVFNTLDNTEVGIYVGSWGGQTGKIWFDDIRVAPGGLVNLIRRNSCPFKVTSEDGKTVYTQAADFSDVRDPKMGNVRWPGDYQYWYEQPVVSIGQGSRLKEGDKVVVSYYHAMNTLGWGVFACMGEPKTLELARRNLANVHKVIDPDGYMLPYDEIRHWGWDPSCERTGMTAAQMLADNTRKCVEIIRTEAPGKPIYAWNDMFDPYHNAGKVGYYYLVRGKDPWFGSWEGLPKDVIIMNWLSDPAKRKQSMKFFADRGHRQVLCGFYDAPCENMASWIKDAADVPGISGVMYTTWANNFSELENYLKVVDAARNAPAAK